jgi:nucleoside-diphosphate-sugar epimerase
MSTPLIPDLANGSASPKEGLGKYLTGRLAPLYDSRGLQARVLIDLLLLNIAYFAAHVFIIFYNAVVNSEEVSGLWVRNILVAGWLSRAPIVSLACLIAFCASGIYRKKTRTRIRPILLVSLRAVGLTYLLTVGALYLLNQTLSVSTLLCSLFLSFGFIAGTRIGKRLFSKAYVVEPRLGQKPSKVEYVLVIGGAGYIGSILVRQLLDAQYHVRVLDKLMFGDESIRDLYANPNFELVIGDFRNIETIVRTVHGMDAVILLGAIVGDPACSLDAEFTLSTNTHAVRMIRDISCGHGIGRFLFASTCSVYGAQEGLIDEESPLAPVSLYAQSKIDAEKALLEKKNGLFHPTILRLGTAFGLSYRMRFDLVVNVLTAQAMTKNKITIINGHQWRPFIHIDDISRAFIGCLEAPLELVSGQIFNVGDNECNLTLRELGEMVAKVIPDTQIVHKENSTDPRSYRVSFSKIANRLGFRCRTAIADGIDEMAAAIKVGMFPEYEAVPYNNAAQLKCTGGRILGAPFSHLGRRIRIDGPSFSELDLQPHFLSGNGTHKPS